MGFSPTRPSLWAVLKNSIGKDLSKMSLPIIFNEPLSALQRWSEDLEYAYLLDKAANATSDAVRRGLSLVRAPGGRGLTPAGCVAHLFSVGPCSSRNAWRSCRCSRSPTTRRR